MNSSKLWLYKLLTWWLPESRCFGFKCALLRLAGAKIGTNVRIYSSATFVGTGSLEIGDDVHIGSGVFISSVAPYGITIGSHIDIGPQVTILTGSHEVNPSDDPHSSSEYLSAHMAGKGTGASVTISNGCWLGARSTILPGVSIPRKTMIAAGAVVTHTLTTQEKTLWAGMPATLKKEYET